MKGSSADRTGGESFYTADPPPDAAGREIPPPLDVSDWFPPRHIGPSAEERVEMLAAVGAASLDGLMDEAIPAPIRLATPLDLPPAESESVYLQRLSAIAARNQVFRSYVGLGYYDTIT